MKEALALGFFACSIITCLILDWSVIVALLLGLMGFLTYGLSQGFSAKSLFQMAKKGIKTGSKVMVILLVIGMLTGSWRASGTIAYFVSYAVQFISPKFALFWTFFLNALLSTVIGTSFGTVATMGVVGMSLCTAVGVNPILTGGAVLSGIFVGDRWSPVSSSALLVATVTDTTIYRNIAGMIRTGIVPFFLTCVIYLVFGFLLDSHEAKLNMTQLFSKVFNLSPWTLLPAVVLLGLLLFRVSVVWTMCASIVTASMLILWVQHFSVLELMRSLILGFKSPDAEVGKLLDGGGLVSMATVVAIIFISCTYPGIFEGTGLVDKLKNKITELASVTTSITSLSITAFITSMLTCNQILCVILTNQLCKPIIPNDGKRAVALEDTCILFPAVIPWSIACAVPVATIAAPTACVTTAFFIWLVPACRIIESYYNKFFPKLDKN